MSSLSRRIGYAHLGECITQLSDITVRCPKAYECDFLKSLTHQDALFVQQFDQVTINLDVFVQEMEAGHAVRLSLIAGTQDHQTDHLYCGFSPAD